MVTRTRPGPKGFHHCCLCGSYSQLASDKIHGKSCESIREVNGWAACEHCDQWSRNEWRVKATVVYAEPGARSARFWRPDKETSVEKILKTYELFVPMKECLVEWKELTLPYTRHSCEFHNIWVWWPPIWFGLVKAEKEKEPADIEYNYEG